MAASEADEELTERIVRGGVRRPNPGGALAFPATAMDMKALLSEVASGVVEIRDISESLVSTMFSTLAHITSKLQIQAFYEESFDANSIERQYHDIIFEM